MSERGLRRATRAWTTASRLRKLVFVCWGMLLIVSFTAVGSFQFQLLNVNRLTLIQIPAVDANTELLNAMTDAQIGLSGYEVSGDRALLQPYFGAHLRTRVALDTLRDKLVLGEAGDHDAARHRSFESRQRLAAEAWWDDALARESALDRGEQTEAFEGRVRFARFRAVNSEIGEYLTHERDESRVAARTMLSRGQAVSIAVTLLALLAMLVLGRRVARTISRPLIELRDTMVRQRKGEIRARAREDIGSSEIRSVAADFNALTEQKLALLVTQERALGMNQITFDIARSIRGASDAQQALDILCVELGKGLGVDRVIAATFDPDGERMLGAQWHPAALPPQGELSAELFPHLVLLADEIWRSEGFLARPDFLSPEVQSRERARIFYQETDTRAVIMAPIGLGDRVIGMVLVLMLDGPRAWTDSEASTVRQVAGFVARASVEAEHQAHQREYVERVEMLDRQKSDFLATVSHELRTPLTSISGYLELLQDGDAGELTAQQYRMLDVINRSTARLRSLIEDVMMLNRIEGGVSRRNCAPVSIRTLITRVGEDVCLLAEKNAVELEIDAGPEEAIVWGDRASLDRAVLNVFSNAIKFSRHGGVVTILGVLDEETRRVLITCQDRGVGIPAEDLGHLFTRFFRASNVTDQSIPGTGLGLSIAKQIVEDHHEGQLRLTSVEDEGTTVILDLPLYEPPETPPAAEDPGNDSHSADVFEIRA